MTIDSIKAGLRNGYGKVILGSVITATVTSGIFLAGFFVTFGGVKNQVMVNTAVLNEHVSKDLPISADEHYSLKERTTKSETRITSIEKQLDILINTQREDSQVLREIRNSFRAWDNKRRGP